MLFQMASQRKLFPDDILIWNYAQSKERPPLDAENFKPDDMTRNETNRMKCVVDATLSLDPSKRPTARHLRGACSAICRSIAEDEPQDRDMIAGLLAGSVSGTPTGTDLLIVNNGSVRRAEVLP